MEARFNDALRLRGGNMEATYRPVPRPGNRNRSSEIEPAGRLRDPIVPDGGAYLPPLPDANRRNKIALLGIDESQVRPPDEDQGGVGDRNLVGMIPEDGSWRPARLRFRMTWPTREHKTLWYKMVWVHLYLRVTDFVEKYFGYGDIERAQAIWIHAGLPRHFIHYAELVARQDNYNGGWDLLLTNERRRRILIQGVIGRVLQTHVFDALLFGADERQRSMFNAMDEGIIHGEGYSRTDIRGQTVRVALAGRTLTPYFWREVDTLNAQMAGLLLPLLQLMDRHFSNARARSMRAFCQDLHHIVSEAGFFAIGIRWSRNIFRFTWPYLGEPWGTDEDQVDGVLYEESRAAVEAADRLAAWAKTGQLPPDRRPHCGGQGGDNEEEDDYPENSYPPSRLAKVQMVCWPMLQRYTCNPRPCEGPSQSETIERILEAQVVHYLGGVDNSSEREEAAPTLQDWIHNEAVTAGLMLRILYTIADWQDAVWNAVWDALADSWYNLSHCWYIWLLPALRGNLAVLPQILVMLWRALVRVVSWCLALFNWAQGLTVGRRRVPLMRSQSQDGSSTESSSSPSNRERFPAQPAPPAPPAAERTPRQSDRNTGSGPGGGASALPTPPTTGGKQRDSGDVAPASSRAPATPQRQRESRTSRASARQRRARRRRAQLLPWPSYRSWRSYLNPLGFSAETINRWDRRLGMLNRIIMLGLAAGFLWMYSASRFPLMWSSTTHAAGLSTEFLRQLAIAVLDALIFLTKVLIWTTNATFWLVNGAGRVLGAVVDWAMR